jgi:predicted phage terminase large subunit-like protein
MPNLSMYLPPMTTINKVTPAFLMRTDFMSFIRYSFAELHAGSAFVESPHLALLAAKLEECAAGRCKRLMICLPPRSLKSIVASVAFPAWVLGNYPHKGIVCASYGQGLADKHAMDTRTVMNSRGYQAAFSSTRLSREKRSVGEFTTTAGGFRLATSVGGVLTGRGGDIIIIDDPLKPQDAYSEPLRTAVNQWYDSTLSSRLNDKERGVVIVIMQRLHQNDLVGHLMEKEHWDLLRLPAIAEQDERLEATAWYGAVRFKRKAGEVLDPRRESLAILRQQEHVMGSYAFEAQYQQNPQPEGGAIIKSNWLCRYNPFDIPHGFSYKVQSWDTANKSGELHDYSVCTTWGISNKMYFLLDVRRCKLEYPELVRAAEEQYSKHAPRTVLIEDRGSGTQLLQDLKRKSMRVRAYSPRHGADKQMRLHAQSAIFEAGRVYVPTSAPWVDEYVRELTGFPGTKHDDQVDSTTQALDYLVSANQHTVSIKELLI